MSACIFCQQRVSTREDAWPQWLTKRFPLSDTSRMEAERGGHNLGNWSTRSPKLLRVGCVCKNCNSGWMSQVESKVKPVIESIIDERMQAVVSSSQAHIAVWAVKTAMVLEALHPNRQWFYTDEERRQLRIVSAIPERTSVWIAKCVNQPNIYSAAKDLWTAPGRNEAHAYVTTMAFGLLAIQVMSIRPHMNLPRETTITYDVIEGPWEQVLVQVWPILPSSQQWPPSKGLAREVGLEELTNRLKTVKK